MAGWKRAVRGVVLGGLALGAYFVAPVGSGGEDLVVRAALTVLVIGLLAAGVVWQVVLQVEDPDRRVDGLALALVVAVLAFALAFYRLAIDQPDQLPGLETRLDGIYFTMSTLLTIGYGDVHAAGQVARGLVLVQMVFNVVVLAMGATTLTNRVRTRAEERARARRAAADSAPPEE
ncbi:potassium channel family protein [Nocardioides sp. YIM 152315]|uniref:potassium channel family protein n=1 Tax=Nocardioides sp. YIM 152315 TaxID=3031760 RepID=UPI0023DAD647|nr:potassium channel family protein [Nocardioides sp. YIM 152315]